MTQQLLPPMIELPASPDAFREAAWEDVLPYYDALAIARGRQTVKEGRGVKGKKK